MTAADRPTVPPGPHPDLDTLADLDAGVLHGADAERVATHAAGCARCGEVLAALGSVRADLRALPAPAVPEAVAARLDAALADLRGSPSAHRPSTPTARRAAARAAEAVADLGAARTRRWHRLKVLTGAAAAAVAVLVAGASVSALLRSVDTGTEAGGGAGSSYQRQSVPEDSAAGPGAAEPLPRTSAGPVPSFDRASLQAALPSLATAYAVGRVAADGDRGPAGPMGDAALRTACSRAIPGAAGKVEAVVRVRYEGRPAYVLLFDVAGKRTAYVVDEQCGQVPGVPATVLDRLG